MSRTAARTVILAFVALVACGNPQEPADEGKNNGNPGNIPSDKDGNKGQPLQTGPDASPPPGGGSNPGGGYYGGITQQDLNNIIGEYSTYVYRESSQGRSFQQAAFRLRTAQHSGYTYMYIEFGSQGPLGAISFGAYMGMFVQQGFYSRYFTFASSIINVPQLSDMPVSIEFHYYGQGQVAMHLKSCGFAVTGSCLNQVNGAGFGVVQKTR